MTDIVGSTEHAAELGDAAWRELVQLHHATVRAALRRFAGREIDTAGDGFFAIFDAPAAAVACALDLTREVRELGLEIRVGIHVGEVEQVGGKVAGITVPIASRIMAQAAPGEVLASSTVRDLAAGSGLTFDDRGTRELKGVPGEWHVYAVSRAEDGAAPGELAAREKRAVAVRRAQSRPIWQRRPRLVAGIGAGVGLIVVAVGLWIWKPWQPPALEGVAENAVGIIDPDRQAIVGEIPVGTRPSGIAIGGGYAWVTNAGSDTISQIELETGTSIARIDVGRSPVGIAFAEGDVWVANSGDRTVSRIDADTGRVVGEPIEVGNAPTALAAVGSLLWVANAADSAVVAIDAATGEVGVRTGVAAAPIALAADADALWVVSEDGAAVSQLDPVTGVTLVPPIPLGTRPTAIALDPASAWVTASDGTVTKIDRASNRVAATVPIGGRLTAIAVSGGMLWVGSADGRIHRLDPTTATTSPEPIATGSAVAALAAVEGELWLAAQPSATSHRGGTLRVIAFDALALDPIEFTSLNIPGLEADGLVGYRRSGGAVGATLLPALASSIPRPTDGGLTYTFQLRPDLVYSTGEPVLAQDFRRAIERTFQVGPEPMAVAFYFVNIEATDVCRTDDGSPVERCDLSAGIVTDDASGTVTFHLVEPDPDFVAKLALPFAAPVPDGVPMHDLIDGTFPGTGPYVVAEASDTQVRLERNPNFRVIDADVRPDGFPDEIVFIDLTNPDLTEEEIDELRIGMVEDGDADFTSFRRGARTSAELFAQVRNQYPGRWHIGSRETFFVTLNGAIPPFDNLAARQAVNFAIDRSRFADLYGGLPDAAVTCQLLPPGWPAYQPYCPYTEDPDASGRWSDRNIAEAQSLIDASGTRGAPVVVGPTFENNQPQLEYLASVLEELGYQVTIDRRSEIDSLLEIWSPGTTQITLNGWIPDYVAPSTFLSLLTCDPELIPLINHCDPDFDAAFRRAQDLQTTDMAAALSEWAALDREGVDQALLAPLVNAGADFVSERLGNYQYSPAYEALFDQMWVQ